LILHVLSPRLLRLKSPSRRKGGRQHREHRSIRRKAAVLDRAWERTEDVSGRRNHVAFRRQHL